MKNIGIILVLFIGVTAFSQDVNFQNSNSMVESQAKELTNQYNSELALTGSQPLLLQKKIVEFLIRKNKIDAQFEGKERLDRFYALQEEQNKEVRDILDQIQYQRYLKVQPKIQPLDTLKE